MNELDVTEAFRWLGRPTTKAERTTGVDATGWPTSIWILHAIYENTQLPGDVTHDDARRAVIAANKVAAKAARSMDLDALGLTKTRSGLGRPESPGAGWSRLSWTDLAARLEVDPFAPDVLPGHRSFPYQSWPLKLMPPSEGSLDPEQFRRLCGYLAAQSTTEMAVVAFYAMLATRGWSATAYAGSLSDAQALYDDPAVFGSPSNLWPDDRSWFVWTDWDLWATKVSGTPDLIDTLANDEVLETVHLAP